MRLWSVQTREVYEIIRQKGVYRCDGAKAACMRALGFGRAYRFLAGVMRQRLGEPPAGVRYPVWAWYRLRGVNKKPDLRWMELVNYSGPMVCLELEVPAEKVLLSDEELWHFVLNDCYIADDTTEEAWQRQQDEFDALPPEAQRQEKRISWQKVFLNQSQACKRFRAGDHMGVAGLVCPSRALL